MHHIGLYGGDSGEGSEKWLGSAYFLRLESVECADGFNIGCERKRPRFWTEH